MISQLTIQNFGLIDRLSLEFCGQLNIFTGETGAGKSILIDALRFNLGSRLNPAQIRDAQKNCTVEVVFELTNNQLKELPILAEYICDDEPLIIINRVYTPDGRTKNKINGFTVTVSRLKEVGNHLLDFHGPHDHQMLLAEHSHINILDRLCNFGELKNIYIQKYNEYETTRKELSKLHTLSHDREKELDILQHQIKELEKVALDTDKYEELLQERKRVNNAEKLYECGGSLIDILENDQKGITQTIRQAFSIMKNLNSIDDTTLEFKNILISLDENSSDLLNSLTAYIENLSFDSDKAVEINRLYDSYYEVLRKYGPNLEEAKKFYASAKQRYDLLINLEYTDAQMKEQIKNIESNLIGIAQKITAERKITSKTLEITIEGELKELGIENIQFQCRIQKEELNRNGADKVIFYISPNAGEDLKPLAEIVSSGEAARVMLALKKALTEVDPIPVLIFDEIDAQIGGRLGTITGKKLKELSENRQVILITHLPQIASFADYHFKVSKKVKDARTVTVVDFLDKETRVNELAKMMSGEKESQIAVRHAHDMLTQAKD
jgi:DNA repair protein RecN (Recombination protein N)